MLRIKFSPEERAVWEKNQELNEKNRLKSIKKKVGRPRKKYVQKKKRGPKASGLKSRTVRFNETAVGHFMYVYTPVQYNLLMKYAMSDIVKDRGRVIKHTTIETIALNSNNPAFRSVRFRKALILYRRSGLHPLRKTGWTLKDAVYFALNSYRIHEAMKYASGE